VLLIATDEAGYGPKLGPLVIASTAWSVPGEDLTGENLHALFSPLRAPCDCGQSKVVVDDSKAVFSQSSGLDTLHAAVSASYHWCGYDERELSEVIPRISASDIASIARAPWLNPSDPIQILDRSITRPLLERWRESGVELIDIRARIITAEAFNSACSRGGNKADLLSESSIGLVRALVDLHGEDEKQIAIYCDRHGGRRYYAGVVQHVFPDAQLQIVAETKQRSVYRLTTDKSRIDIQFTVKGDSFTPVALSSMHAKYLRERMMQSLNAYFFQRHRKPERLIPTAGYPVDADRFLTDIAPIISQEKIDREKLVRSR
jgi:hypothetical protein